MIKCSDLVSHTPGHVGLVSKETHASGFRQARRAKRAELIEDYVELIAELLVDGGEARQVDIAARLGVAQPTVAKMLQRLEHEGYVTRKPYRGTFLTPAGERLAALSRERHQVVESFLRCLGISPETARCDAEGIEHHVSPETLDAFQAFVAAHVPEAETDRPPSTAPDNGPIPAGGRGPRSDQKL